ncbi:trypsin-like serine peptidase [Sphaerisporangium fuscum]|uniref:trypsin-like serine peptidase n=1 Tax=Sphaerisporangium fuscum TaxID=2835868 RepID=UPI001BDD091C|nr:hypothetical protein [Sphaerisporangium fuscum]
MTPILPLLAVAPLVAGLVGPPPTGPAASGDDRQAVTRNVRTALPSPGVVQHTAAETVAEQRRVLAYWTSDRMEKALPAGLLGAVAKIGRLAGGALPLRLTLHSRSTAGPAARGASSASPASAPGVNTSGARWTAAGAVTRTTGRVFFTLGSVDYVCSAGAVRSQNMDVVVTAGHCVKDGVGAWSKNWTFVPGYDGGRRPYGVFTARRMYVAEPWSQKGDDSHDVAMVAVNPSPEGHLNEVVGGQEIGFAQPRGRRAFGFGFPADPPYDGEHLIYCSGALHGDPHNQTRDQGMRCDLTAGSSGGPWLSSFDPATGQGVVTSVSSFKYSDDPGTMYGPYFGDQARHLFEAAQRG